MTANSHALHPPAIDAERLSACRALRARTASVLAGGVASSPRRRFPLPLAFSHGDGARLVDVDGNDYVDYVLGYGPLILGHRPIAVERAVMRQLAHGALFGAGHELEAELGEAICRTVPSAERCVLSTTGTEAVITALRLARAATGRRRIVKFRGHYHGWSDAVSPAADARDDAPATGGVDPGAVAETLVCDWDDLPALDALLDERVAAVLMEPIAVNGGCITAAPGYLDAVRAATRRCGALLVFDEVVSGYRVALGGAQERCGVEPDLTILGKALGGGFPVSAVAGPAAIMDVVERGDVVHRGTFNGHPVAAAAAVATVQELERGPGRWRALARMTDRLAAGIRTVAGAGFQVRSQPGIVQVLAAPAPVRTLADAAACDRDAVRALAGRAAEAGVHMMSRGLMYLSTEHGEADVDLTLERLEGAFARVDR
jgi:glutamate-1-semialdehyde 2,1-aminomutase